MTTTALQKVESVGVTAAGALIGALAGGPVGFGIGLGVGAAVDIFRAHKHGAPFGKPPLADPTLAQGGGAGAVGVMTPAGVVAPIVAAAMTPGGAGLPPGADNAAAANVIKLVLLGHPKEAKVWLQKFQTSVGLPSTGQPDASTRSLLVLVDPNASKIPANIVLGF